MARAETLTEADVVRRVAERSATLLAARAEADRAEARERGAGLHPNPSVGWAREHVPGDGGGREDAVSVTVPIQISGRRSAETALARAETRGKRAEAARARSAAVLHALELFYAAIAADARAGIARRSRERLAEAVRVLARRQEEGNVAGYERVRLELELELAESEVVTAEAEAERTRMELGALAGLSAAVTPRGELRAAPAAPTRATPPVASLEWSASSAREARAASDGAASAWLPAIELSGGVKAEATDRTRYGYVAGVSVELPLFSRGQDLRATAHAEERVASARTDALREHLRVELARAAQALARAAAELARFEAATRERSARLERAIESGYREGTRSLGDLIDAEDARAAIERRKVELAHETRRAELALRAARGEFER